MDVWFQDEARVGQRGTLTRTFAKKGTRPRLIRQQQFEYAYIFGAVCPVRDEAVGLIMPAANTEAMLVHLEHISRKIPAGRHGVIILDKAAWHTTKRLKKFSNIMIGSPYKTGHGIMNPKSGEQDLWDRKSKGGQLPGKLKSF